MTLHEAVTLFPECEEFESTGILPEDSLVRKLARETFGSATLLTLHAVCIDVWHTIAKDFIECRAELERSLTGTGDQCKPLLHKQITPPILPFSLLQLLKQEPSAAREKL